MLFTVAVVLFVIIVFSRLNWLYLWTVASRERPSPLFFLFFQTTFFHLQRLWNQRDRRTETGSGLWK